MLHFKRSMGGRSIAWVCMAMMALVPLQWLGCEEEMLNHEAEIVQIHFLKRMGQDTMFLVSDTVRPLSTNISLQVSHAADLRALVPVFELSDGAQADCKPGRAYDFSGPFSITVTAANGRNRRTYVFTLGRLPAPPVIPPDEPDLNGDATLSNFRLVGVEAKVTRKGLRVYMEVPPGTDLTNLVPQFDVASGATVEYELGSAYDFSEPLYLRVTSEDGLSVSVYRVYVRHPAPELSAEAQVYAFRFHESDSDAEIDGARIYATVRSGSDLSRLVPTFKISDGATASIAQHAASDFSQPVLLEVQSEDGSARSVYTVHVEERLRSEIRLEEVLLLPMGESAVRDDKGYMWFVGADVDVSSLRTYIRLGSGCRSNIANGSYLDYSQPHRLVITSEDGLLSRTYMLQVKRVGGKTPSEKGLIETWGFDNAPAKVVIHGSEIHCRVPFGTDISKLIPSFTIKENPSWVSLSRAFLMRGDNNDIEVKSGQATLDFTQPRTFEVWRKNPYVWELAPRSRYTVYVGAESGMEGEANLLSMSLRGVEASVRIRGGRVDIAVPSGTDLRSLVPDFRLSSGARASIASGSSVDFSHPVPLVITSGGGNRRREYTVVVESRRSDQALVVDFSFAELSTKPTVQGARIVTFAGSQVDITRLTPRVEVSRGATCSMQQGVLMDFSRPVTFDVVSEDRSITRRYTVVVEQRLNSEAELLSFRFAELEEVCVIEGSRVLMPDLPAGVQVNALTPVYTVSSGATCSLPHGVAVDFSGMVRFTVTSEDGSMSKTYSVRRSLPSIRFDFEEWMRLGSGAMAYEHPVGGWSSGNAGSAIAKGFFGRPDRFPVRRSSDAHSGSGAAVITTEHLDVDGNSIAAGALWLGGFRGDNVRHDPLSGPQFGMAWPGGKPATLKGWYKYKPGETMVDRTGKGIGGADELDIYAVLFHGSRLDGHTIGSSKNIVAIARLGDVSAKGVYTPFEVEFEEVNGGIQPGKPLQYTVVLSSSRQGAMFIGAVGSELVVDDLEITLK